MVLHLVIGLILFFNISPSAGADQLKVVKHTDDCSKYFLVLNCGAHSHFNTATGSCDSIEKAECIDGDKYNGCKRTICFFGVFEKFEHFDFSQCTHLMVGPAVIHEAHPYRLATLKMYNDIAAKRKLYPDLKVIVRVGGSITLDHDGFAYMTSSPENRKKFMTNMLSFLRSSTFDGLNVDWMVTKTDHMEYKARHTAFVEDLRIAFDKMGARRPDKPTPILSVNIYGDKHMRDSLYDIPKLSKLVDFFTLDVMSLKEHPHHSPLFPMNQFDNDNVFYVTKHFLRLGAPREKLVLSIPLYGNLFTFNSNDQCDISKVPKETPTRMPYNEYCSMIAESGTMRYNLPNQEIPYLVKDNTFLAYEDEESVVQRVNFMLSEMLGGVLIYQVKDDVTKPGSCGKGDKLYPMHRAVIKACKSTSPLP